MTARLWTIGAGALYGIVAGACAALAVMRLMPGVGHAVELRHLSWDFGWAVFYSWPLGLVIGASAGAFLYRRAPKVTRFRRLIAETCALASIAVGVLIQFALPIAWGLPRGWITVLGTVCAATLAAIGTLLLKPFYWSPRARVPDE